jgi:uncharacterized protein (TIGR02118 family)
VIKLVFCLRRRDGMTLEEFQSYWLNHHAPLVRSHTETLRIRRYVQVHTKATPMNDALQTSRGGPDAYDGVAELWWDSMDDLVAASSTPEGRAAGQALLDDERTFIDLGRSPLWLAEEHEIVATTT